MIYPISFAEFAEFLPLLFVPVIFAAIFITVVVTLVKRANADKRNREAQKQSIKYTDGNGRTQQQADYLAEKRRQLAQRKIVANDGSHEHIGGKVEKYDKIVGSLGDVNDEGCDELDGVRLIEHDESYCDDPDHLIPADNTDLVKAIVVGEVINSPRFKQPYRRK